MIDKTDAWDMRPSNREIVQTQPGRFEAQDKDAMTTEPDWKPTDEMIEIAEALKDKFIYEGSLCNECGLPIPW